MTPVPRSRRSRCWMICLVAALAIGVVGCAEKNPPLVVPPPPVVLVGRPIERNITNFQVFTARTEAVESVDIKSRVSGYLTEILFQDGGDVQAGDVLFKIDDRPYKAALDEAKANLEYARAALVATQADYEIGVNVRRENAAAISQQDLNKRLGARDEAAASVKQAEAALENAQLNFDWCTIAAPISGRVNRHFVDAGNLVSQDVTTLTNIVSIRPIWAYFDVDQNTALDVEKLIAEGKMKRVRDSTVQVGMSLGNEVGFPIAGTLDFVSNQLDPNTGSLRVRAVFPNKDGFLGAGLFSRIRVPVDAPHDALLMIDRAVGTNQGQKYVLVVNEANEVEYRAVDVGQLHDGLREVLRYRTIAEPGGDGADIATRVEVLKPTDKIIVEGLQRVRPGAKVDPKLVNMQTLLSEPPTGNGPPSAKQPATSKQ